VGVYLRGSAARGRAAAGVSDLDLVVLHWDFDALAGAGEDGQEEAPLLRAQLEAAFAREGAAARGPWTKVEFRTLAVDPRGALAPAARAQEAGRAPPAGFRPPAADVPWAHVLKTQAACVAGWDLPRALPPAAATWRPVALDAGLPRRLARALGRAEELRAAGRPGAAAAALRWGLKRLVRAAAELAVLRGVSRRPSRDLFWCAAEARRAFPPYAGHLRSAAELAVQPRLAGADLDAASRACLVLGAWLRAELARLASDGLLEAAPPAAAGGGARERAGRRIERGGEGRAVPASRRAPGARLRAAVSGAVLAVRLSEAEYAAAAAVRGRRPPPLRAPSDRDVPCVALEDAPGVLEAMLTGRRAAHPFVVRGAARAGPGGEDLLGRLSLLSLAKQAPWERVSAQVSPSLDFRFCDPAALRAAGGRVAGPPPSRVASMPAAECLARMLLAPSGAQAGAGAGGGGGPGGLQGAVPPLFFEGDEFLYLKTELPRSGGLRRAAERLLAAPPFFREGAPPGGPALRETQGPRLWAGPAGAVSPLHYDADCSWLLQARGEKRMLFYPADDLHRLYPYPDAHPLRRRARACPTDPRGDAWARYPLFRGLGAWEARLAPGDAAFFPPRWAHYTEAAGPAASLTWRFAPPPAGGARGAGSAGRHQRDAWPSSRGPAMPAQTRRATAEASAAAAAAPPPRGAARSGAARR